MNRRDFVKNMAAGSAGLLAAASPLGLLAREELVTLTILHTNDLHCHIEPFDGENPRYAGKGGLARISQYVRNCRLENPNTLLFDAGDMYQGTPYFNYFKGELILKVMSEAGYDAGTLGNHEFDNGLEGILEPLPHARFPLICSNYDFSDTILAGKIPRWQIFEKSGIRVGVYGLGIELKGLVSENNYGNTRYSEPLAVALEMERFLALEKKCDLVVCLSHVGLKYEEQRISDLVLAAETFHTDLFVGGHTHSFLAEPVQVKNKADRPVIVNQAWWGGLMLGRIDFVFEREKRRKKAIFANQSV